MTTLESVSYVKGVYQAFHKQMKEYVGLTEKLLGLQGQIVLAEKQLQIARDHLCMVIEKTPGVMPPNWDQTLKAIRFVGLRLAKAALQVLSENGHMTTDELIQALNDGMYRWRSNSPARELNAALLRQADVTRNDDTWTYKQFALDIPKPAPTK